MRIHALRDALGPDPFPFPPLVRSPRARRSNAAESTDGAIARAQRCMCESARWTAAREPEDRQTPYRIHVALESVVVTAMGPPANTAPSNVSSRCPPPCAVPCHRRSPPVPLLSVSPVTVTVVAPPAVERSTTMPSTTAAVEHAVDPVVPCAITLPPFGAVN